VSDSLDSSVHPNHQRRERSVRVQDSVVGMTDTELERAFDPFYRADESRGLSRGHGLAIVKRLVRQFGWTISAHSRPGEGTTIEVTFVAG
jgi:signal transduction histidine kinase